VASAAVENRVARTSMPEQTIYLQRLEAGLGPEREIMRKIISRA
jgi:malate dehydrogenase (oxaloacetate-decarboxylating)(NADP+)